MDAFNVRDSLLWFMSDGITINRVSAKQNDITSVYITYGLCYSGQKVSKWFQLILYTI